MLAVDLGAGKAGAHPNQHHRHQVGPGHDGIPAQVGRGPVAPGSPDRDAQRIGGVELMLEQGADPDGPPDQSHTPLKAAINFELDEVVKVLLDHGADPNDVDIQFQSKIKVGKFVDIEKPSYLDAYNDYLKTRLGDKFKPYGVVDEE